VGLYGSKVNLPVAERISPDVRLNDFCIVFARSPEPEMSEMNFDVSLEIVDWTSDNIVFNVSDLLEATLAASVVKAECSTRKLDCRVKDLSKSASSAF